VATAEEQNVTPAAVSRLVRGLETVGVELSGGRHLVAGSDRGLQINDAAAAFQTAIAGNGVALGRTSLVARVLAEGRLVGGSLKGDPPAPRKSGMCPPEEAPGIDRENSGGEAAAWTSLPPHLPQIRPQARN
jgi:DNA-binding transcriptional LysR family regulator